jgi:SNF2 family DNA or RNA helicase
MLDIVKSYINHFESGKFPFKGSIAEARYIARQDENVVLWQGRESIGILLDYDLNETKVAIQCDDQIADKLQILKNDKKLEDWDSESIAALFLIESLVDGEELSEGIKYTREGMIKRVIGERLEKALNAQYKLTLSDNIFGEHSLRTENGLSYNITLRDFQNETGYIDNIDWKTNKLGTTKHIMYVFNYLKNNAEITEKLDKTFPFIEIYTDPANDYKITWYYPHEMTHDEKKLINQYFGNSHHIDDDQILSFAPFLYRSRELGRIKIRQEVFDKVESQYDFYLLENLEKGTDLDFSIVNAKLYKYQQKGIEFATFRKSTLIADEMGLGKTLQAITTALMKKMIFGFTKTLVICPATVKYQWKNEIEKFVDEKAVVVEGFPAGRNDIYLNDKSFFHIINYETVLRDLEVLNEVDYDFVILDEAQKIKNYETKIAGAVKKINKKHGLVITGTPIENNLLDLYSVVQFLDPHFLSPQWEFSYQHCIFDKSAKNRILGYYNLQNLKKRLNTLLLRREKKEVFDQLPNVIQKDIYVKMTPRQSQIHSNFGRGIAKILKKKFKTPYDWQRLLVLLNNMRMVCDSTHLIDKNTNHSAKLDELKDILFEKLYIQNSDRKIIIFSEWVTMLEIIGNMLNYNGITFAMLSGKTPVKKRNALVTEFENNPECKVFLSSETGGAGLNLQMADTVINFEIPWNPAKKNQRIGRIDRLGQKKNKLFVYNLLCFDSIEIRINTGLSLKQNLFDGVLSPTDETDEVDFSEKGRSQFIKKLELIFNEDGFKVEESIAEETIDIIQEILIEAEAENISDTDDLGLRAANTPQEDNKQTPQSHESAPAATDRFTKMEEVMTKGMEFLTGLYQMSTGAEIKSTEKPQVKVNKDTGEITMTFKMDF